MQRRDLMWLAGLTAPGLCLSLPALATERELRIGIQKYGSLVVLKERGLLESGWRQGWTVTWTEFPGGPQLLEALNVRAIDFGTTGEAPPIFAQAAAHRCSMSATSRRRRRARRSSFPRTRRSPTLPG